MNNIIKQNRTICIKLEKSFFRVILSNIFFDKMPILKGNVCTNSHIAISASKKRFNVLAIPQKVKYSGSFAFTSEKSNRCSFTVPFFPLNHNYSVTSCNKGLLVSNEQYYFAPFYFI